MGKEHTPAISCTRCKAKLPWEIFNTPEPVTCPSCGVLTYAAVFPAASEGPRKGEVGDALLDGSEASCFYHAAKKAVVACEMCGRFLCSLCDIELGDRHLCSGCISSGRKKGKIKNLGRRRTLHDEVALALAVVPVLFVWPTLITAPLAIILAIRNWNAPGSIIPRTKIRFILALLIAGIQVAAWTTLFVVLITGD
jgi:hypothetical protein